MSDDGYEMTYAVHLDDLNQHVAQFAWLHDAMDGRAVRLSLPRQDWEQMGRPGVLTVKVES